MKLRIFNQCVVVSIFLLLLSPAFAGLARGDGIPVVLEEVHSVLRENRQLAYIELLDDEYQRMDLFLGIVSLEVDRNYTIALPLRTMPIELDCVQMSDDDFNKNHQIDTIDKMNEKQNKAGDKLRADFVEIQEPLIMAEILSLPISMFSLMVSGLILGGGTAEHYEFDGISIDIHSLETYDSVQSLYETLNMPLPEDVNDTIAQYSAYHVAVIESISRPPIPEVQFNALQSQAPNVLSKFKRFVAQNPVMEISHSKYYDPYGFYYESPELREIRNELKTETLRHYFGNLVSATYGLGTQQGYQLSFKLPLFDNQVYFPLGTTPAWSAVSQIKVVFDIPDDKEIEFSIYGDEVFHNGRHFYIWEYENESPNYDLEGAVVAASFGTSLNKMGHEFNAWIYDNSFALAIIIFVLVNFIVWFAMLFFIARYLGWKPSRYTTINSVTCYHSFDV